MTRIYLIRHGQSEGNLKGYFQGSRDVPLSDLGRKQAEKLGERCSSLKLDAVYSSVLSRAHDTAKAVAVKHGMEVIKVPGLEEIHLGVWEGRSISELEVEFPEEMHRWRVSPHLMTVPGGESLQEASDRFFAALGSIIDENPNRTVAVVAHGGVIRYFFARVRNVSLDKLADIKVQGNTSVNLIEYENGKYNIIFENDSSHLD